MNATEADGYVVYSTQLPQSTNTTAVDVGNVTQYTLGGLVPGNLYNITMRAYQDLLGPESSNFKIVISNGKNTITDCSSCCNYGSAVIFQSLSWSLLSNRTSPVAQYSVSCPAVYVLPDHIVWEKNGAIVVNSTSGTVSYQLVDAATDNYTNILTVTGDHHMQTISCSAVYDKRNFHSTTLTINGPLY